jgi:hypothetical protein
VTACFVPSSPSSRSALYRLLSNACNLNKIFIGTMPSKIFSSSLARSGRKKSAANIVHFSRAQKDTKTKGKIQQYLKTNKENHVSRFILGIHRHLKDHLNRAALIVLDGIVENFFCFILFCLLIN